MILYGLASCDTCRKARKALPEANFVDVRSDGVPPEVLQEALTTFGDALLNRRSTTWRGLSEDERAMAPDTLIGLHPTVMKRPLIKAGDALYLGWDATTRAALGAG